MFWFTLVRSNLKKQIHVIKIWLKVLIKNMPPESFWVLKISSFIYKEKYGYKIIECKKTLSIFFFFFDKIEQMKDLFRTFSISSIEGTHWSVTLEITDIKCRAVSKYFYQRTQQHGGCTKPLRSVKFL